MKMMDCVEVIVEKREYSNDGVHLGMQGWIFEEQYRTGYWLVNFPQCGENDDIATLGVREEDIKVIPVMNACVNEQIKAKFEAEEKALKNGDTRRVSRGYEDISDYMI